MCLTPILETNYRQDQGKGYKAKTAEETEWRQDLREFLYL